MPFSRGILARSLLRCGLDPVSAYSIALRVQGRLVRARYTRDDLRAMVLEILEKDGLPEIAERYRGSEVPAQILVKGKHYAPFSKGILARSLRVSAIDYLSALLIAQRIENQLLAKNVREISEKELLTRTRRELSAERGEEAARRYMTWRKMVASDYPLVVLIGGPTGAGKSTLAIELASRMEITQVVSTDVIREILRTMFSEKLLPAVHKSSYIVGKTLKLPPEPGTDEVLAGFHQQSLLVNVGVEAMIRRAIQENVDLIVNGVHIVPGILDLGRFRGACIVQFVITVSNLDEHLQRFLRRERSAKRRKAKTYVDNFHDICRINDYIVRRAREEGVPTIDNIDTDESAEQALAYIIDRIRSSGLVGSPGRRPGGRGNGYGKSSRTH